MINSINIPKIVKSQSTGTVDSVAQAFSQNRFINIEPNNTTHFEYKYPIYTIEGATYNYYAQNAATLTQSINLSHTYTMVFSENSESLSGFTEVKHELYRIKFEDYLKALNNSNSSAFTETIIENLKTPLVTYTEVASGATGVFTRISGNRYSFSFPNQFKLPGQYTQDTFRDKAQYFINTKFTFPKYFDRTIGDIQTYQLNEEGKSVPYQLIDYYRNDFVMLESSLGSNIITGNTPFSGLSVDGAFITFFTTPKKPNLYVSKGDESINIEGKQSTFAPTFNFSNVDDGDFYRLMVTYDTTDTNFTGPNRVERLINKQDGDAEYVRTFSTPLLPNKQFLYKIGNTKQIISIFGSKQQATVWTEPIAAETSNDGKFSFAGTVYVDHIDSSHYLSGCTIELSGVYNNSSVDLYVDTPSDSTIFGSVQSSIDSGSIFSNSTITTTDGNGHFDFGRMDGGTYTLKITPPTDYAIQLPTVIRQVTISADIDLEILLTMVWGNQIVIFADPYVFL